MDEGARKVMTLPPLISQLDRYLQGFPDAVLTAGLIIGAMIVLLVAFRSPPILKAAVLAWIIAP